MVGALALGALQAGEAAALEFEHERCAIFDAVVEQGPPVLQRCAVVREGLPIRGEARFVLRQVGAGGREGGVQGR